MHETYDSQILNKQPACGPCLGIIGGGQLARMTAMSALQLGYNVVVLEHNPFSPAATLAAHSLVGDWNTLEALTKLAERVDVLTLENEFVDADLLRALEKAGHSIWPDSRTLSLVQDKFIQKQTLQAAGLPIPSMIAVNDLAELESAAAELGLPLVLKARRSDGESARFRPRSRHGWRIARGARRSRPACPSLRKGHERRCSQNGPRHRPRRYARRIRQVAIIMGSDSDWPALQAAADACAEFGIACDVRVVSARRAHGDGAFREVRP